MPTMILLPLYYPDGRPIPMNYRSEDGPPVCAGDTKESHQRVPGNLQCYIPSLAPWDGTQEEYTANRSRVQ